MTVSFDQLVEKLPAADGGFRRRLIAGSLVTFAVAYIYFPDETTPSLWNAISIKDVVTSPSVIFVATILIYAVGGIVEMIGQLFVVRAVGETVHFTVRLFRRRNTSSAVFYYLSLPFRVLALYFGIYLYFLKGFFGVTKYALTLDRSLLSKEGIKFYRNLSPKVRQGLARPLGNNADYAWEIIECRLDARKQKLIRKTRARTKEVLVVLTSIIIIMIAAAPTFQNPLFDLSGLRSQEQAAYAEINALRANTVLEEAIIEAKIAIIDDRLDVLKFRGRQAEFLLIFSYQLLGVFLILMFRGYFIILRTAIVDLIEFSAGAKPHGRVSDAPPSDE